MAAAAAAPAAEIFDGDLNTGTSCARPFSIDGRGREKGPVLILIEKPKFITKLQLKKFVFRDHNFLGKFGFTIFILQKKKAAKRVQS